MQLVAYDVSCELTRDQPPGTAEAAADRGLETLIPAILPDHRDKRRRLVTDIANARLAIMAVLGMFFQGGLTGSAWVDWALYTGSPLHASEIEKRARDLAGVDAPTGATAKDSVDDHPCPPSGGVPSRLSTVLVPKRYCFRRSRPADHAPPDAPHDSRLHGEHDLHNRRPDEHSSHLGDSHSRQHDERDYHLDDSHRQQCDAQVHSSGQPDDRGDHHNALHCASRLAHPAGPLDLRHDVHAQPDSFRPCNPNGLQDVDRGAPVGSLPRGEGATPGTEGPVGHPRPSYELVDGRWRRKPAPKLPAKRRSWAERKAAKRRAAWRDGCSDHRGGDFLAGRSPGPAEAREAAGSYVYAHTYQYMM
jgi:hypothetical protein